MRCTLSSTKGYTMQKLTHFRPEDVLTDVLRAVHVQGTLYCRSTMNAPWGFRVPRRDTSSFHVITGGQCWLDIEGVIEGVSLTPGDLVILPHGHAHILCNPVNTPATTIEYLDDLVAKLTPDTHGVLRYGQGGAATSLVCGGFQLEGHRTNPLVAALPPYIHIRSNERQLIPWLQAIVEWVESEAQANRAGAETVITRLSEILFIQAMRAFTSTNNDGAIGWLKALHDPQIGPALGLIHSRPHEPWTVAALAAQVGLSRTAFTMKFKQLVGESPLRYLTGWRLNKAAAELRTGTAKLTEIARLVGYDSEVALSKAFKRTFGVAPGAYRHSILAPRHDD
jgi:AraC-like DNA-binding protein